MKKARIPRTTVGRFWGYNGVLIALSVSLAGNLAAAYLHNEDPSWVELSFAGIPPLTAFLSIEIVNHNPWADEAWGPWVRRILLGVVAPASAVVSFIHLVNVVMDGRETTGWSGLLNWLTAVLTALLIDGMMFGGTAALLIKPKTPATAPIATVSAYPDWRGEIALATADLRAELQEARAQIAELQTRPAPKVRTSLAKQPKPTADRKRFPATEHPLFADWAKAYRSATPWTPEVMAQKSSSTVPAARMRISRFEKALAE